MENCHGIHGVCYAAEDKERTHIAAPECDWLAPEAGTSEASVAARDEAGAATERREEAPDAREEG